MGSLQELLKAIDRSGVNIEYMYGLSVEAEDASIVMKTNELPEALEAHVKRMDFVLGAQTYGAYNVGLITYGGKANLNVIRNIKEPILERAFYEVLKEEELKPVIEGNQR